MNKIIILGVNADIGFNIATMYLKDGFQVIGTFRLENENTQILKDKKNIELIRCNLLEPMEINSLSQEIKQRDFKWTNLFSSVGTSTPIGNFFDLDFLEWEKSISLNFTNQLRTIHSLYNSRDKTVVVSINLMAGGGTNSAFKYYSAYCVSKIGLIKMCELIDSEYDDVKMQIVGPGFVQTKTHLETIEAGTKAGKNFERVKSFIDSGKQGTSFEDIYKCLRWADNAKKAIVGGRNFSVVHDVWGNKKLENALLSSEDMYRLRREGNDWKE